MDDKRLERIEMKLDDISDHLASIDVTLAQQHGSIKEHIRRTVILEQEVVPLRKKFYWIEGAFKLVALIATMAAVVEFIRRQ